MTIPTPWPPISAPSAPKRASIRADSGATIAASPGLDFDTARKLNILRGGLVLAAPSTPGAAAELNTITTRLQSTYGKGRATHDGKVITGDDAEALMGSLRKPASSLVWLRRCWLRELLLLH